MILTNDFHDFLREIVEVTSDNIVLLYFQAAYKLKTIPFLRNRCHKTYINSLKLKDNLQCYLRLI